MELFDLPLQTARVNGINLAWRTMGHGMPLLLLHGHPQTHVLWHRVAPLLAQQFALVLMDLRGYGDSGKPAIDADRGTYSKRTMAADAVALMRHLGHAQFDVLAHDRGARVAHRMALDHPQVMKRLMLLDIAPTLDMYRTATEGFARAYWHWFFLIQPAPLPEILLKADPVAYVRGVMGARHAGLAMFDPSALAEYERCAALPGWAQAVCEDYRAAAGIDLEHDQTSRDVGQKIACPLAVLWGEHGVVHRFFKPAELWAAQAADLRLKKMLPCGHYIAEEAPHALLNEALIFFKN